MAEFNANAHHTRKRNHKNVNNKCRSSVFLIYSRQPQPHTGSMFFLCSFVFLAFFLGYHVKNAAHAALVGNPMYPKGK